MPTENQEVLRPILVDIYSGGIFLAIYIAYVSNQRVSCEQSPPKMYKSDTKG